MKTTEPIALFPPLAAFVAERQREFGQIPGERKSLLKQVAEYIRRRLGESLTAKLTFICTHNSRRSHLSQIWAKVAADVYGIDGVETFSGGTEATTFNPRAVDSLRRSGFVIDPERESDNPVYFVRYSDAAPPQRCFSKVFDESPNPRSEYCAVMTCSEADEACPVVMGCDLRAPIRYEDPKVADDTPGEAESYDERSKQICREMLFMISKI